MNWSFEHEYWNGTYFLVYSLNFFMDTFVFKYRLKKQILQVESILRPAQFAFSTCSWICYRERGCIPEKHKKVFAVHTQFWRVFIKYRLKKQILQVESIMRPAQFAFSTCTVEFVIGKEAVFSVVIPRPGVEKSGDGAPYY